jgi:membrane-associated phospholipid phosphatase
MIRAGNRSAAIACGYVVFCVLYLAAGTIPVREPVALSPGPIDLAVPFVPWTIWVYLSHFPLAFVALWAGGDDLARTGTFYAMLMATIVSVVIFVLFPTTGTRVGLDLAGPTGLAYRLMYLVDVTTNWFPSLHAALAALAAARFRTGRLWVRRATGAWAVLISLSTLTTKQHQVVDVVGGLLVAAAAYWLAGRWLAGRDGSLSSSRRDRGRSVPESRDFAGRA